ncbi:hypothetical protein JCM8547_003339 [Rhodosporidiobolus lusitaniae]
MPLPLPTELIEQVLGELEDAKSTLARCCRLSKALRRSSEAHLYRRIDIELCQALGSGEFDEEVDEAREFWYTRRTRALVDRLFSSRRSTLVREVHFAIEHVSEPEKGMYTTPKIAFATVLCALPNLDSFNIFSEYESDCLEWLNTRWSRTSGRARPSRVDFGILNNTSCAVLEQLQEEIQHLEFSGWLGHLEEVPSVDLDNLYLRSFNLDLLLAHSH